MLSEFRGKCNPFKAHLLFSLFSYDFSYCTAKTAYVAVFVDGKNAPAIINITQNPFKNLLIIICDLIFSGYASQCGSTEAETISLGLLAKNKQGWRDKYYRKRFTQ